MTNERCPDCGGKGWKWAIGYNASGTCSTCHGDGFVTKTDSGFGIAYKLTEALANWSTPEVARAYVEDALATVSQDAARATGERA